MALITCPECGNKISDRAKICIHCGFPIYEVECEKLDQEILDLNTKTNELLKRLKEMGALKDEDFDKNESSIEVPESQNDYLSLYKENRLSKKVVLKKPLKDKLIAIKYIREYMKMGLKDAKDLAEAEESVVCDGVTVSIAEDVKDFFEKKDVAAEILDSDTPLQTTMSGFAELSAPVSCPRCGSTEYYAGAAGYSVIFGWVGSGATRLTCLKCGYKWKPGKK